MALASEGLKPIEGMWSSHFEFQSTVYLVPRRGPMENILWAGWRIQSILRLRPKKCASCSRKKSVPLHVLLAAETCLGTPATASRGQWEGNRTRFTLVTRVLWILKDHQCCFSLRSSVGRYYRNQHPKSRALTLTSKIQRTLITYVTLCNMPQRAQGSILTSCGPIPHDILSQPTF